MEEINQSTCSCINDSFASNDISSIKESSVTSHENDSQGEYDWKKVKKRKQNMKRENIKSKIVKNTQNIADIPHSNRYLVLIDDDETEIEHDLKEKDVDSITLARSIEFPTRKRPAVLTKQNPENDYVSKRSDKFVPGISSYARVAKKKVLILTDSILSRIKMPLLNKLIHNGNPYRKTYPGCKTTELAHYCTLTLKEDKPEAVVINVGTNNLGRDTPEQIYKDIMNIVDICHSYGVNQVYVSSLVFRPLFRQAVSDTNYLLRCNEFLHNYILINNDDIKAEHISKDKIHPNNNGLTIIGNNIIRVINGRRY